MTYTTDILDKVRAVAYDAALSVPKRLTQTALALLDTPVGTDFSLGCNYFLGLSSFLPGAPEVVVWLLLSRLHDKDEEDPCPLTATYTDLAQMQADGVYLTQEAMALWYWAYPRGERFDKILQITGPGLPQCIMPKSDVLRGLMHLCRGRTYVPEGMPGDPPSPPVHEFEGRWTVVDTMNIVGLTDMTVYPPNIVRGQGTVFHDNDPLTMTPWDALTIARWVWADGYDKLGQAKALLRLIGDRWRWIDPTPIAVYKAARLGIPVITPAARDSQAQFLYGMRICQQYGRTPVQPPEWVAPIWPHNIRIEPKNLTASILAQWLYPPWDGSTVLLGSDFHPTVLQAITPSEPYRPGLPRTCLLRDIRPSNTHRPLGPRIFAVVESSQKQVEARWLRCSNPNCTVCGGEGTFSLPVLGESLNARVTLPCYGVTRGRPISLPREYAPDIGK